MSVICPRYSVKKERAHNNANDNKIRLTIQRYGIQLTIQRYDTEVEIRSQGSRTLGAIGIRYCLLLVYRSIIITTSCVAHAAVRSH